MIATPDWSKKGLFRNNSRCKHKAQDGGKEDQRREDFFEFKVLDPSTNLDACK